MQLAGRSDEASERGQLSKGSQAELRQRKRSSYFFNPSLSFLLPAFDRPNDRLARLLKGFVGRTNEACRPTALDTPESFGRSLDWGREKTFSNPPTRRFFSSCSAPWEKCLLRFSRPKEKERVKGEEKKKKKISFFSFFHNCSSEFNNNNPFYDFWVFRLENSLGSEKSGHQTSVDGSKIRCVILSKKVVNRRSIFWRLLQLLLSNVHFQVYIL